MHFSQSFIIFIGFTIDLQSCLSYKTSKLEGRDFCAALIQIFITKPTIFLGSGTDSAMIISQIWNSTSNLQMCSHWVFTIASHTPTTEFIIVINRLKLRKERGNCIDYIQFKNGGYPTEKFCEEVMKGGMPIFTKRIREFKVDVYIDKKLPIVEPLELSMVVTSTYECGRDDFQCDPQSRYSCINKAFVKDGIINCLPPCRDENQCTFQQKTARNVDASSVALTAITSLIFTMVIITACFWFVWKYHQYARDILRGGIDPQNNNELAIELPQTSNMSSANSRNTPNVPPVDDLPPSYESLFPNK